MTTTAHEDQFTPAPVEVTQADRDAAERWGTGPVYNMDHLAESFARHRIAHTADLLAALQEAVDLYGKPGGPWNVPSDPGGWLERARAAIARAGV